jgi:fatty-acyl-CoA synthase
MARSLALSCDSLAALPATLAERSPAAEAVLAARGRLTFRALADRSAAVARGLAARGVGPGTHVGLLAPNCPEWLVIAFALWRCGAVLVPISTLYRPRELHHAIGLADVELLISVRRFLNHDYVAMVGDALCAPLREVVWLDLPPTAAAVDLGALLRDVSAAETAPALPVDPAAPAAIFFTSGTMALPKGVVHSQRGLLQAASENAAVLGLTPDDRTWGYLPFFFAGGLVSVALATLVAGGGVVLQEVFEPGETLGLLERERVTVFFAWPHQAEALVAHPDFPHTRLALQKGVGANTKWADRIYPPDHHAVGSYGMTETPPICTAWPWDAPLERRRTSHGPPVGSRELRICDPATGTPLPPGTEGEICVRGPTLFLGYYKEDPATTFDPDGYFHTGDLGRVDEVGALHFIGRLKDVIKSAGVNIAAAEIEAVLLAHPAVAAAHAVGVPDERRGEDVAAFVVLKAAVTTEQLLAHCRDALATYKVPRHLWIRREDELPQKGSGKVDKPRLREVAAQLAGATAGGVPC